MKRTISGVLALMMLPGLVWAKDTRHTWMISASTWVKLSPAEKGAPANTQPLRVDAATLAQALRSVQFVAGSDQGYLFERHEAERLAQAMAEALALARPGEDLELLSTAKRDAGPFGSSLAVTARAFAQDGKLNLIVHEARKDFLFEHSVANNMPVFQYGSRTAGGTVHLSAPAAEVRRADWIVLPLGILAPASSPLPMAVPQPSIDGSLPGKLNAGSAAPEGSAPAGTTSSTVICTSSTYTIQANDRYVVCTSANETITLPDPGGSNASRALTIMSPSSVGKGNNLTIRCGSGPKLRNSADGFVSANGSCIFDVSERGEGNAGPITCVSDGMYWYCQ